MDQHYTRIRSRKNGKRWTTMLIKKLWNVAWDQWEHRNGILHDTDHHLLSQKTDRLIAELYEDAKEMSQARLPHHLKKPVEEILEKELDERKRWLEHATNAFKRAERRLEDQHGNEQRTMLAWRLQQHIRNR
jgi:hypothetical protein